jgi:formate dehydrogenase major subunit
MVISTSRAEIEARAKVTDRMRPLKVDGKLVHQVALPWHWGFSGPATGDMTNDLVSLSGDPNVSIEDTKSFTCDVRAGRRHEASTARIAGHGSRTPGVAPDRDHPSETGKAQPPR